MWKVNDRQSFHTNYSTLKKCYGLLDSCLLWKWHFRDKQKKLKSEIMPLATMHRAPAIFNFRTKVNLLAHIIQI